MEILSNMRILYDTKVQTLQVTQKALDTAQKVEEKQKRQFTKTLKKIGKDVKRMLAPAPLQDNSSFIGYGGVRLSALGGTIAANGANKSMVS